MDCNECKTNRKSVESIPYIAYEGALTKFEKQIKRLWIALIVAIILMFASNGLWLAYLNQYNYASTTTTIEATQDGEGVNIVGGGDIDYGAESESGS